MTSYVATVSRGGPALQRLCNRLLFRSQSMVVYRFDFTGLYMSWRTQFVKRKPVTKELFVRSIAPNIPSDPEGRLIRVR